MTVFANGKNVRMSGDLRRRTITACMDPNMERPYERSFNGDPVAAVRRDRGRYVAACLTIARAYVLAGLPDAPAPLASVAGRSRLIAGALVWLGAGNPIETVAAGDSEHEGRDEFAAVMDAWPSDLTEYKTGELLARACETDPMTNDPARPDWADAIRPVATDQRAKLSANTPGVWLRDNRDRTAGQWKLKRCGSPNRPRWKRQGCSGGGGYCTGQVGNGSDKTESTAGVIPTTTDPSDQSWGVEP